MLSFNYDKKNESEAEPCRGEADHQGAERGRQGSLELREWKGEHPDLLETCG